MFVRIVIQLVSHVLIKLQIAAQNVKQATICGRDNV